MSYFPYLFAEPALRINRLSATSCRFAAFLWQESGNEGRADWTHDQWQRHLTDPNIEFYAVYCDEEPAGCTELTRSASLMRRGKVEITSFSLLPEFADETFEAALRTRMVEKAFAAGQLASAHP